MPGSTSASATEMFHEGLLLPPVKMHARGAFNADLERLILANSRQPELVRGDMHAQMAATRMGAARVAEMCARFGAALVMDAFAALLDGAAAELRAAVAALPDGEASAEGFMDSDGVEARPAGALRGDGARRERARSPSIFATATGRRGDRSISARRWSRPACSMR